MPKRFYILLLILFIVPALAFLVISHWFHPRWKASSKADPPNIVMIVLDAARVDHFSFYGYGRNTTPRMDAIGQKGAIFLNHFSNATTTSTSLPKLFFSRYYTLPIFQHRDVLQWRIGSLKREDPQSVFLEFDAEQIFLTELLSRSRYRSAIFHNNPLFGADSYFIRSFDEVFTFDVSGSSPMGGEFVSAMSTWIEQNSENRFFIYCHIMSPHEPYPSKDEDREFLSGSDWSSLERVRSKVRDGFRSIDDWSDDELRCLKVLYDSNLKHTDKWIGRLFEKLCDSSLEDRTLFIITSDHGENLGEHDDLWHGGYPWDSLTKIPLIMVYPPLIPRGVKVSGLTESIDVMPTILDICSLSLPIDKSLDGVSLLDFVSNPHHGKTAVFTEESIRTEKYKLILSDPYLFDLEGDPSEEEDISTENPLLRERLLDRFDSVMNRYRGRFSESRRKGVPPYPFYMPISEFEFTPEGALNEREVSISDLRESNLDLHGERLLINREASNFGLLVLPGERRHESVRGSCAVPDGSYMISILVETPEKISDAESGPPLSFRFESPAPFSLPGLYDAIGIRDDGYHYSFLNLGESVVENDRFSLELAMSSWDEGIYVLRMVKFIPEGSRQWRSDGETPEDFERRRERLKSLGYAE